MILILFQIIILFFSIVIHECSHGWVALLRGDPTAKQRGRLTLNPIKHMDPFGSVALPILEWLMTHQVFFAYAKPVPINPWMLKNPKGDMFWVGIAGPLSNMLLAVLFAVILRLSAPPLASAMLIQALATGVYINLWLAVLNLMPIPPLDGSKMLMSFANDRVSSFLMQIDRMGIFILMLLMMTNFFDKVIEPIIKISFRILIGY